MTLKEAIKKLKNGEYSVYKDVDNIPLLNHLLSTCFPKKETHPSYIDNFFCGNQVKRIWLGRRNNEFPVPVIKLSEIEDPTKGNAEVFKAELKALLAKHNASISFTCSDGSDTHGLNGDHLEVDINGIVILQTSGWGLDQSDL